MLAEPPFSLLQNLNDVDDAIDCNADIADAILECGLRAFGLVGNPDHNKPEPWRDCAKSSDVDKAHSTIRQFYRDWSADAAQERNPCYGYVFTHLGTALQNDSSSLEHARRAKVLVPGAGLGRLVYEICRLGFDVEGNEISYHQLLASSWVLNYASEASHPLYPFATQFTNLYSRKQQLRKVMIPDLHPGRAISKALTNGETVGEMNMTSGDFVVLYGTEAHMAAFDAITTVFFIDTAPNLLRYIDTIRNCLKLNGIWINVGPLLWHFDVGHDPAREHGQHEETKMDEIDRDRGIAEPGSFELTNEEVILLLERKGFSIEHREVLSAGVGYVQDPESMIQNLYHVSCWVARKIA
jgi:carnosine N-methyltransferase